MILGWLMIGICIPAVKFLEGDLPTCRGLFICIHSSQL